jgi:hypothetical protein
LVNSRLACGVPSTTDGQYKEFVSSIQRPIPTVGQKIGRWSIFLICSLSDDLEPPQPHIFLFICVVWVELKACQWPCWSQVH